MESTALQNPARTLAAADLADLLFLQVAGEAGKRPGETVGWHCCCTRYDSEVSGTGGS
jgi:hypothetical protein